MGKLTLSFLALYDSVFSIFLEEMKINQSQRELYIETGHFSYA